MKNGISKGGRLWSTRTPFTTLGEILRGRGKYEESMEVYRSVIETNRE